jgi:integrase/recombinase XerD
MPVSVVRLSRSRNASGELVVRLGVWLLDEYLEFLGGRCRPNTVLAVAYDLKVFFTVVGKPPRRVRPADVLAFMTAQRTGGSGRLQVAGPDAGGVSARTLRRRLSSVSDLPRAFRTADFWLIHAADCRSRYSSRTCRGVRY